MQDPKQIPHLIRLWEDDSPVVRHHVQEALISYGGRLESLLSPFWQDVSADNIKPIKALCDQLKISEFNEKWNTWCKMAEGGDTLEKGLSLLAFLENGYLQPSMEKRIDMLYDKFLAGPYARNEEDILKFLFVDEGLGIPKVAPFHPLNSHPVRALKTKEGFPISLVCIGILLARRIGITLRGFQLPGIFFLMTYHDQGINLFDPFQKGKLVDSSMLRFHIESFRRINGHERFLHSDDTEIILEVLRQIITGYSREADLDKVNLYSELYDGLEAQLVCREVAPNSDSAK